MKLEPGKEVVVRGVNGAKKVVNKDTKVVFEPNYRNAVRLQGRADAGRENVIVVTSFTDLNGDKVADVLGWLWLMRIRMGKIWQKRFLLRRWICMKILC